MADGSPHEGGPFRVPSFPTTGHHRMFRLIAATALVIALAAPQAAEAWPGDPYPNRITAHDIAHSHEAHGHHQWQGGEGTPRHTWDAYRRDARRLRNYLAAVAFAQYVAAVRANLVDRWSGVAACESGGNWSISTGNGYYGGLQFSLGTWRAYGGAGMPNEQPAWYQAGIADRVRIQSGLQHWPICGSAYG